MNDAAQTIQTQWKYKQNKRQRQKKIHEEQDAAALKIQNRYRGNQARKRVAGIKQ